MKDIIMTIKELYDWAVENGYENYKVFCEGNGCDNISLVYMDIDTEKKEIYL